VRIYVRFWSFIFVDEHRVTHFPVLGVIPVAHMTEKSMWMVLRISKGSIIRTSFTVESVRGDGLFFMSLCIIGIICQELSHEAIYSNVQQKILYGSTKPSK